MSQLVDVDRQLGEVATARGMTPEAYADLLKDTVLSGFSQAEAAKAVGDIFRTNLDPLSEEVIFLRKGGAVTTAITYAGYTKIQRRDGISKVSTKYEDLEDGEVSCTATLGRYTPAGLEEYSRTEFLSECRRGGPVWKQMPRRMLGHRAIISATRLACGINLPSAEELEEVGFTGTVEPGPTGDATEIVIKELK